MTGATRPVVAVLPAIARGLLEPQLPPGLDVRWFGSPEEAKAGIAEATIAWVDMQPSGLVADTLRAAGPDLAWVSTIYAGLDAFPLDWLRDRGVTMTNGTGINAVAVAEYAVMGMLAAAKRFDHVVRAADRREWPWDSPGKIELAGSRAVIRTFRRGRKPSPLPLSRSPAGHEDSHPRLCRPSVPGRLEPGTGEARP